MRILTHVLALLVLLDSPSALTAAKKHRHQNYAAAAAADHDRSLQDVDAVAESIDYNDLDAVAIATPPETEVATPTLDCVQCTNIPTKHMLSTQIMCSTYSYAFERRCGTEVGWWGRDGNPEYCQYSCWMNGAPYASQRGAPCCERDDVDDVILANILAEPAVVEEEEEEEGLLHFTTTNGVIDLKAPIAAEKVHTSDGTDIPDINDEVLKEIAAEELAIVEDVVDELESETDEPTMIPATDDPTMLPATATDEPSFGPTTPHPTLFATTTFDIVDGEVVVPKYPLAETPVAAPVVAPVAEADLDTAPVAAPVAEPVAEADLEAAPVAAPVAEPVAEADLNAAPIAAPVAEPVAEAAESEPKETEPHPYAWLVPTFQPTITFSPTPHHVWLPPTPHPTNEPTANPTVVPTTSPTKMPTGSPSHMPTDMPVTSSPTSVPSPGPSMQHSDVPSVSPTPGPTGTPSARPSSAPVASPSASPTGMPTTSPSAAPTRTASASPSEQPTSSPTHSPSEAPSASPTSRPTAAPTSIPSSAPTPAPSSRPSASPSATPSASPSSSPTSSPSSAPTANPSSSPSALPSTTPSVSPTSSPSSSPTSTPTPYATSMQTGVYLRLVGLSSTMDGIRQAIFEETAKEFISDSMASTAEDGVEVEVVEATILTQSVTDSPDGDSADLLIELSIVGLVHPHRPPADFSFPSTVLNGFVRDFLGFTDALYESSDFFHPLGHSDNPEPSDIATRVKEWEKDNLPNNNNVGIAIGSVVAALAIGLSVSVMAKRNRDAKNPEHSSLGSMSKDFQRPFGAEALRSPMDSLPSIPVSPRSPNTIESGGGGNRRDWNFRPDMSPDAHSGMIPHSKSDASNLTWKTKESVTSKGDIGRQIGLSMSMEEKLDRARLSQGLVSPTSGSEENLSVPKVDSYSQSTGSSENRYAYAQQYLARNQEARDEAERRNGSTAMVPRQPSPTAEAHATQTSQYGLQHQEIRRELYDCYAPPGPLGVVIDTTPEGPMVHSLKPTSRLAGLLQRGDLVVGLDDIDTRGMTAATLTRLMAKRSQQAQRKITLLSARAPSEAGECEE